MTGSYDALSASYQHDQPMTVPPMFLNEEEVAFLTGRKRVAHQVVQLRKMGIPFYVNARGAPVIARVTIEGKNTDADPPPEEKWQPRLAHQPDFSKAR